MATKLVRDAADEQVPIEALAEALLPCLRCGYDLRGAGTEGNCPECGQPFRRIDLYKDVVRQKIKLISDDLRFVVVAGIILDTGILASAVLTRSLLASASVGALSIPIFLFFMLCPLYLWIAVLFCVCVARVLYQIHRRKTLLWGQVCAYGMRRQMLLAAVVLAVPPMLLLLST